MPAELELLGPLWAHFGGDATYYAALVIEGIVAALTIPLSSGAFRGTPSLRRWLLSALLTGGGVLALNIVLNGLVLLMVARAARGK